jgi:acetoin utilization deacetylase AcuC-like enzyme
MQVSGTQSEIWRYSLSTGSTLTLVDASMAGDARRASIPIGGLHHAGRDHTSGFCVFNDRGIAAEVLRARHGLRRIAYVDIDAHHGDVLITKPLVRLRRHFGQLFMRWR